MNRRRLPQPDNLTPRAYRCPACCITARMLIDWPSWVCQVCKTRLVPADLHPRPTAPPSSHLSDCDIQIDLADADQDAPANPAEP